MGYTDADRENVKDAAQEDAGGSKSQATQLVELASVADLFHDSNQATYATVPRGAHRETWGLRSKGFRAWLARRFYEEKSKAPGSQALQDALTVLDGKALYEGPERQVFVRVAEHEGAIYLDLGDADWTAVEITADDWTLTTNPPVLFRRPRGMKALPVPERGGDIADLWPFLNVVEEDRVLVAGVLVMAYNPRGPYPMQVSSGPHGSAKSTVARVMKRLVDPGELELRTQAANERDLMIAARNSHVLAFENVSNLSQAQSDALCRLSTGSSFGTRELYADDEEVIFTAKRPVSLNGITEVVTSADALDRAVLIKHPQIEDKNRRTEEEFDAKFELARPGILGALLDAVSAGIRNLPTVDLGELPRMADFAKWATACEVALGFDAGAFMKAYTQNRTDANRATLEDSPIAEHVKTVAAGFGFSGTASELMVKVKELAGAKNQDTTKAGGFPQSGQGMRAALARIETNLRVDGVIVTFPRKEDSRRILSITTVAAQNDGRSENGNAQGSPTENANGDGPLGDVGDVGDLQGTFSNDDPAWEEQAAEALEAVDEWRAGKVGD